MAKVIELKPCPFCGSEAYVGIETTSIYWSVGCSKCHCHFERTFTTKMQAIKFWNRRWEDKKNQWRWFREGVNYPDWLSERELKRKFNHIREMLRAK